MIAAGEKGLACRLFRWKRALIAPFPLIGTFLLLFALLLLAVAAPARAEKCAPPLRRRLRQRLGAGVEELAARAPTPARCRSSQALSEGACCSTGHGRRFIIQDKTGASTVAATGAPARQSADGLKTVRLNNKVRRAIDAALGGLNSARRRSGQAARGGAGRAAPA